MACRCTICLPTHHTTTLARPLRGCRYRATFRARILHASCNGQPCDSHWKRGPERKGARCQAVDTQYSSDLHSFNQWIIDAGVDGTHGVSQRVELYQYGHEGRGLRATCVRSSSNFLHLMLRFINPQNTCFSFEVSNQHELETIMACHISRISRKVGSSSVCQWTFAWCTSLPRRPSIKAWAKAWMNLPQWLPS